jgi:hypothetical protein
MKTRYGIKFADVEVCHPVTAEPFTVDVRIDYVESEQTRDTPASLDWEYTIIKVEDGDGNKVESYRHWLTHDILTKKVNQVVEDIL